MKASGMNRRAFTFGAPLSLGAAFLPAASCYAAALGEAAVRAFYESAVRDHNAGRRLSTDEFLAAFTPATQAAWRAGREAPATAGPVVNAFFGPVLPGVPVALSDVSTLDQGPGHARARVHLLIRGAPTHVDVAAKLIEGRYWRIEDIVYANGASLLNPQRR